MAEDSIARTAVYGMITLSLISCAVVCGVLLIALNSTKALIPFLSKPTEWCLPTQQFPENDPAKCWDPQYYTCSSAGSARLTGNELLGQIWSSYSDLYASFDSNNLGPGSSDPSDQTSDCLCPGVDRRFQGCNLDDDCGVCEKLCGFVIDCRAIVPFYVMLFLLPFLFISLLLVLCVWIWRLQHATALSKLVLHRDSDAPLRDAQETQEFIAKYFLDSPCCGPSRLKPFVIGVVPPGLVQNRSAWTPSWKTSKYYAALPPLLWAMMLDDVSVALQLHDIVCSSSKPKDKNEEDPWRNGELWIPTLCVLSESPKLLSTMFELNLLVGNRVPINPHAWAIPHGKLATITYFNLDHAIGILVVLCTFLNVFSLLIPKGFLVKRVVLHSLLSFQSCHPVILAAEVGSHDTLKVLLQHIPSAVNVTDINGDTALHVAARRNDLVAVELLMEAGANVDVRNKNHKTAIDLAPLQARARLGVWVNRPKLKETTSAGAATGWKIAYQDLEIVRSVGSGAFGEVYKAIYNTAVVAVKQVRPESTSEAQMAEFRQEAALMAKMPPHPHVIQFMGICEDRPPSLFIVVEFCDLGDLLSSLQKSQHEWSLERRRQVTADVASGMVHVSHYKIVHRDLSARNILLQSRGGRILAKVADLGLSRQVATTGNHYVAAQGKRPIRWTAPEALRDSVFSTASDVWSFGVLYWEVITLGDVPYPQFPLNDNSSVMSFVLGGGTLDQPLGCPAADYSIIRNCTKFHPASRPSFSELHKQLEKLAKTTSLTTVTSAYDAPAQLMPSRVSLSSAAASSYDVPSTSIEMLSLRSTAQ